MRIAIIGQQAFGKSVLEAFRSRGDQVAGVFCASDKHGSRPDPLLKPRRPRTSMFSKPLIS